MKAIEVKYLGPTNFKGSRYKAWTDGGSVTLSTDYALNSEENHKEAAKALCKKMNWHGILAQGSTPKIDVFVFVEDWTTFRV